MVDATTLVFLGMSATLVVAAVLQLYPAHRYSQNVLYERGVKLLSASLLALVVGWLSNDLVAYQVVDAQVLGTFAQLSFTTSSALYLWANWEFAQDFLRLNEEPEFEMSAAESEVGFEDAATEGGGFGAATQDESFGARVEEEEDVEAAGDGGPGSAADGTQEVLDERRD